MRQLVFAFFLGICTVSYSQNSSFVFVNYQENVHLSWEGIPDSVVSNSIYFSLDISNEENNLSVKIDSLTISETVDISNYLFDASFTEFSLLYVDFDGLNHKIIDSSFYNYPPPSQFRIADVVNETLTLSWESFTQEVGYIVKWGKEWPIVVSSDSANAVLTNDTIVQVNLPVDGQLYYLQVAALGNDQFVYPFSESIEFQTQDFTAPTTPLDVQVEDLKNGQISVQWQPSIFTDDFYSYYLYLRTDQTVVLDEGAGIAGIQIIRDSTAIGDIYSTSITVSGDGYFTHYISVAAVDISGNISGLSDEIAIDLKDEVAPEAPVNLVVASTGNSIHLTWNEIDKPGDFESYKVYIKQNASIIVEDAVNNAMHDISGLAIDTYYDIYVTSIDTFQNESHQSEILHYLLLSNESEPNETISQANTINKGINGNLSNGDIDLYKISVESAVAYDFVLVPDEISGQSLNHAELILLKSDSTAANYEFIYYPNALHAIRYYSNSAADCFLSLNQKNNTIYGNYWILVNSVMSDSFEINDNESTATELNSISTYLDLSIYTQGDEDYFFYEAGAGDVLNFEVESEALDLSVKLLSENGNLIKEMDQSISEESFYTVSDVNGKLYFVVSASINESGGTGEYQLNFSAQNASSQVGQIIITEINPDFLNESKRGFLELYNTTNQSVNLHNWKLHGAIEYTFNNEKILAPGERIVISSNSEVFQNFYRFESEHNWNNAEFKLSGDEFILMDENGALVNHVVTFTDNTWPDLYTDVGYHSLELKSENTFGNSGEMWQASLIQGGTPGKANSSPSFYEQDGYELNQNLKNAKLLPLGDYQLSLTSKEESLLIDLADMFKLKLLSGDSMNIEVNYDQAAAKLEMALLENDSSVVKRSEVTPTGLIIHNVVSQSKEHFLAITITEGEAKYDLKIGASYTPLQTPYSETFEAGEQHWLGYHLEVLNADENFNEWHIVNGEGKNGSKCTAVGFNDDGNDDWLILPALKLGKRDFLSFDTKVDFVPYESFVESFEIWIGDKTAVHPEDFHTRIDSVGIENIYFRTMKWDLMQYANEEIKLAIRNVSIAEHTQYIDQIAVGPQPPVGVVIGIVSDDENNAISGADINIDALGISKQTDTNGSFILSNVQIGTHTLDISAEGYQEAKIQFSLTEDDTIQVSPALKPVKTNQSAYLSGLEPGQDFGEIDSTLFAGWEIKYDFGFEETRIFPTDNYMLVYGGTDGYINSGTLNYWTSSAINLKDYISADLKFQINHDIRDPNDQFFVLIYGKYIEVTILDMNEDGESDNDDYLTGKSSGWEEISLDLSDYSGLENGEDLVIVFAMLTNEIDLGGFGVAIDQIEISGTKITPVYPLQKLSAKSYQSGQVTLTWEKGSTDINSYKVFRKAENATDFEWVTELSDTTFIDRQVKDYEVYDYYIISATSYGESTKSNVVSALPGSPDFHLIKFDANAPQSYFEDFENINNAHIPQEWAEQYSNKGFFDWIVSDSASANADGNILYPGHSHFVYVREHMEETNLVHEGDVILESPWFDISAVTTNLVMRYSTFSHVQSQHHYVAYRTDLDHDWIVFDSVETSTDWIVITEDLTELIGENHLQIGFWFVNPEANFETVNGWAIDDFSIQELPFGNVSGFVKNSAGELITNAKIKIQETGADIPVGSDGSYQIQNVFHDTQLHLKASGWYKTDYKEATLTIKANETVLQDIVITPHLDAPQNLKLTYSLESYAKLKWDAIENRDHLKNGGATFKGTYNLYKGTLPEVLQLYRSNLSKTEFEDTVSIGQNVFYRVSANYSTGASQVSNRVSYDLRTLAYMQIEEKPLKVLIPYGQMESEAAFDISNLGKQSLSYEIEFKQYGIGVYPIESQDIFGEVVPGSGQSVTIPIQLSEFISGSYIGQLVIKSNDPNSPVITKLIEIELEKAKNDLKGTIVNKQTGNSISADVYLVSTDTLINQSGNYLFHEVTVGNYVLKVKSPGYYDYIANLAMTGNAQTISWNVKMDPILDFPDTVLAVDNQSYATLTWSKPSGVNSGSITGYSLYKQVDGGASQLIQTLTSNERSYNDYAVTPGVIYSYFIVTNYSLGNSSPSAALEFEITDLAPVVSGYRDVTIKEDTSNDYLLEAYDPNGKDVIVKIESTSGLVDLNFDGVRVLNISGKQNKNGTEVVEVTVSDGKLITKVSFKVVISPEPDAPYFINTPKIKINRNTLYSFDLSAKDPDGDAVTIEAKLLPTWLAFHADTHSISGTPQTADVGFHQVLLQATDGTLTTDLDFTIEVTASNNPPVFNMTANQQFNEMDQVAIAVLYTDVDGDPINVIALELPAWMTFDTQISKIVGVPDDAQVGNWTYKISISDGFDTTQFSGQFTIKDINQAPQVTSVPSKEATVSAQYQYQVKAKDPDGDTYIIRADTLPDWLIMSASGLISGTPSIDNAGQTFRVVIGAQDEFGKIGYQKYDLKVKRTNNQPYFTSQPDATSKLVTAGDLYEYVVSAYDEDGDEIIYALEEGPDWLTLSESELYTTISGTPSSSDVGSHVIAISITDGLSNPVQQVYLLEVDQILKLSNITGLSLYPIPAIDFIYFDPPDDTGTESSITVFDLSGLVVYTSAVAKELMKIDLSGWKSGIYLVRYQSQNLIINQKIQVK